MADIDIRHRHELRPEETRALAEDVAAKLNENFPIEHHWEGESLHFKRRGVLGRMDLNPSEVRIQLKLGLVYRPMKRRIEDQIRNYLTDLLGA